MLPNAIAPEVLSCIHARLAHGSTPAFLLDYDGTLTPIVNDPDRALLTEDARATLCALSQSHLVSVVSGRSVEKLQHFLQIDNLILAGSHGFDIQGRGATMLHPIGVQARGSLLRAKACLDSELDDLPGYATEDNKYCISAHYRMVEEEKQERVHRVVQQVVAASATADADNDNAVPLRHKEGKMVHELRPAVDWDKGKAVQWLLEWQQTQAQEAQTLVPVYIGDDVSDEDAFRVVRSLGGIAIKVLEHGLGNGTPTAATHQLGSPDEVLCFLRSFLPPTSPS